VKKFCGLFVLVAALCVMSQAKAEDMGRIFLSAEERAALERARHRVERPPQVVETPKRSSLFNEEPEFIELPDEDPAPALTVNGMVKRSDGTSTVWINGVDNYQGDLSQFDIQSSDINVKHGRIEIRQADGGKVKLKPGQTYNPASQEIVDAYYPKEPPAFTIEP